MTDTVGVALRALAHPLRRQLLSGLLGGECDVGVMAAHSAADQPVVSKHLAVLREAGLVEVRVDGRRRCYSLKDPALMRDLLELLGRLNAGSSTVE